MSELGRKLVAIRERYLAEGGTLLTREQIDAEIRERRGETGPSEDDDHLR